MCVWRAFLLGIDYGLLVADMVDCLRARHVAPGGGAWRAGGMWHAVSLDGRVGDIACVGL